LGAVSTCNHYNHYDETLSLTRGIGEAANLVALFHMDEHAFGKWVRATKRERIREFGAMTLFPFHQTYNVTLRACCAEVPLVRGDQYTVGSFKRNSMIVAVKEMLFELHCKLHSPA
jgi:hypothetical protein